MENDSLAKCMKLRGRLREVETTIDKKKLEGEQAIARGDDASALIAEIGNLQIEAELTKKALSKAEEVMSNDHAGRGRRIAEQADQSRSPREREERKRLVAEREARLQKQRKIVAARKKNTGSTAVFRDPNGVWGRGSSGRRAEKRFRRTYSKS